MPCIFQNNQFFRTKQTITTKLFIELDRVNPGRPCLPPMNTSLARCKLSPSQARRLQMLTWCLSLYPMTAVFDIAKGFLWITSTKFHQFRPKWRKYWGTHNGFISTTIIITFFVIMKCTFDWKQTTQWSFDILLFWINHMVYLNKKTVAGPPKNHMEATYKTHPLGMHLWLSLLFLYSATGVTTTKTRSTLPIKRTNGQTNKQTIKQTTQSNKESNKQTNQTNKPINQSNKQAKTNIDKQLAISFSTFNSFGKKISSSPPDPGDQ